MSDNNKELIKKDLVYILQLNSKVQYDNISSVKQARNTILRQSMFKTSLGAKYTSRLEQIINKAEGLHKNNTHESNLHKCILCDYSLDNASVICNRCLAKYKIMPSKQEEAQLETTQSDVPNDTPNYDATEYDSAKSSDNNITEQIPEDFLAGSYVRDLFSEVFTKHTRRECEDIFIAGTYHAHTATSDTTAVHPKPWLFSRVLAALLAAFVFLYVCVTQFHNSNAITGFMFIASIALPFSILLFIFEINVAKNIGIYDVIRMVFFGGITSILLTLLLYEIFPIGRLDYSEALIVAFLEALTKLLVIIAFYRLLNPKYILSGMLIGASIGAGFAVFENIGYAFRFYLLSDNNITYLIALLLMRAWGSLGSHVVWTAITAAGLVLATNPKSSFSRLFSIVNLLIYFCIPVILHTIWDCPFMDSGSIVYIKLIALIAVAWITLFVLINAGLRQINEGRQS
ncbi:MAG: PrsW family intramembrane metalloprotease [Lachnospiraceae bacterium]|nr:PrsW family intramembrane metalloprotease [Lachnospiraceae bacterium]